MVCSVFYRSVKEYKNYIIIVSLIAILNPKIYYSKPSMYQAKYYPS
jgi:hypothetical protein